MLLAVMTVLTNREVWADAGAALSFDGNNDWVSLPVTQDLQLEPTDFTLRGD